MKSNSHSSLPRRTLVACLGAAVAGAGLAPVRADAQPVADDGRLEKLEQENKDLRQRLDSLEALAQKEGLAPSGQPAPKFVKSLSEITISGFVQASYFYNSQRPADGASDGYLWNTTPNSFSVNKVKLTLASKPVERSGEKYDAGFRVSMIWGEDAPVLNTGSPAAGFEALREAYAELNVPIGTGLDIKVGQLISLLNYESGDGGAANNNFSQGFQWFYTGNGPSAGVQLGYSVAPWLELTARVQNGMYAGPVDSNDAKTGMGSIGLKPDSNTWINLIGFGGDESDTMAVRGGSVLAGRQWGAKFNTGLEFDYFNFAPHPGTDADLWSIGAWLSYDVSKVFGVALRAEYLDDPDGGGLKGINLPGRPGSAIMSPDPNGNVSSIAFTLNIRPVANLKFQPEIRYDHTSYQGGFDGDEDRFVFGAGVTYLF